jgi:serine/threonine-protein kinase RsbT
MLRQLWTSSKAWLRYSDLERKGPAAVAEQVILINSEADILAARQHGRTLAAQLGLSTTDQTLLATAISEVARNIITYAGHGQIEIDFLTEGNRQGIHVVARDEGPGIPNLELAMQDGYSTAKTLGLGLPGAKRLVDEFAISSSVGKGTIVTMTKWKR